MKAAHALAAAASLLFMGGCKPATDEAKAPPPRPVLSIIAKPVGEQQLGFTGSIQPRYQTEVGFRVLGRIIARNVDVGEMVVPGQILAEVDPLVLDLAVRSSEADVARARAQLLNTTAAEARASTLLGRQVTNEANFETAQQAREAAAASVQQAEANLAKTREQRSYATLLSDQGGVVTTVDAEVGQTIPVGKRLMTLARTDLRDAVLDLPEDMIQTLGVGTPFTIKLQADPAIITTGTIREIAPQADAATRTRRVKITLDQFAEAFRLGATVSAAPRVAKADPAIELPRSALLVREGETRVWIVDSASQTVSTVTVHVISQDDRNARIASGIEPGMRVVVAGANSLVEGQSVKIAEEMTP